MEAACVRHTDLPHTSRLFSDFLYQFDRVARFYDGSPFDRESYRRAAARIDFPGERRAALVAALREQNGGSPALDALARPGTAAVLTGQQVGLFSGPCYTVYKAITAANLARRLTESGIPAVAVFWLATQDHDFAEVNHCWSFDAAHRPVRLEMAASNVSGRPAGSIPVEGAPAGALRESLRDFPFCDEVMDAVERAYPDGRTLGDAFTALLRRLLAPLDLLFLDPLADPMRRLAAPLLREAVLRAPELTARVLERNRELAEAGYHAQVHVEERTSFVFLMEDGRRTALQRHDGGYAAGARNISTAELADRAADLSPNALLRPVVEDYLLPTVAYVGGPAELAYLAQAQALYHALLGRMPVPVPRQSATLLDARAARIADRYRLSPPDFFVAGELLRERMARALVPPALAEAVGRAKSRVSEALDELGAALGGFDRTRADAFGRSRRKIEYQLAKIERKTARESLRRDERAAADAAYFGGLVFPEKRLQERLYTILPFLARHGLDLIDRLAGELARDCRDHRILRV